MPKENCPHYRITMKALSVGFLIGMFPALAGGETITINFAVDGGPAQYRASGFLHAMSNTTPASSLVTPLKPRLFRCAEWSCLPAYNRVTSLGAKMQLVMSDSYGYPANGPWPGDGGNYSNWENIVRRLVNTAKSNGQTLEWDIWNEPNSGYFWGASGGQGQYFETWRRAYVAIRAIDPNAVILGPSTGGYQEAFIEQFLSYAKANNVLPNIVSWHEWYGGAGFPAHAQTLRSWMASNGINISRFSINEMIGGGETASPGVTVSYLANIERAGIESAAHACWDDADGSSTFDCDILSLDGILTTDALQPRSAWWAYKGYADVTGRLVGLTAGASVDGVAGRDAAAGNAQVILGRQGGGGNPVTVQFTNVGSASFLGNTVHVVAQRIPMTWQNGLSAPTQMINANYAVTNNQFTVVLTSFNADDAFTLKLTGNGTSQTVPNPPTGLKVR